MNFLKNIGPGTLVTAAFIGPGTVTVCTLAGNQHGFTLLWALGFAIIATIILQEMSARLGIVSGSGLGESIRAQIRNPFFKIPFFALIISAIFLGNAAYEAGNLAGAAIGIELITSVENSKIYVILVGIIVFLLLFFGSYKTLERFFIAIVLLMSIAFILTAIITKPSLTALFSGLLIPRLSTESAMTVIALTGTTIVPYNLFLHSSLVGKKWTSTIELPLAVKDLRTAILLGGLISISIVVSGAATSAIEILSSKDLAGSLEPIFGSRAKLFFGFGMFAAGITSTITAPLAAAFALQGLMGWDDNMKSTKFRSVWIFILLTGIFSAFFGFKPIDIIRFAQFANGLLLPVIAGFLLYIVNRQEIMKTYKNTIPQNTAGLIVLFVCCILGAKSLFTVIQSL